MSISTTDSSSAVNGTVTARLLYRLSQCRQQYRDFSADQGVEELHDKPFGKVQLLRLILKQYRYI